MNLVYRVSAGGKQSDATYAFESAGSKWDVTVKVTGGKNPDGSTRQFNKKLEDDKGELFRILVFPLWIPENKRAGGSGYAEMKIDKQITWGGRTVTRGILGPGRAYYDPATGFLVGAEPGMAGVRWELTGSNVPGLAIP